MSQQPSTPTSSHVTPSNTALPTEFYSAFNISPLHVQLNNTLQDDLPLLQDTINPTAPIIPQSPLAHVSLFDDLHEDHNLATNADLMYEILYQASNHVPGWKTIPFEIFCSMVEIKPLLGGFTNLLVSVELKEEFLTNETLQATRPETLKKIIASIQHEINVNDNVVVPVLDNPTLLRPVIKSDSNNTTNSTTIIETTPIVTPCPSSPIDPTIPTTLSTTDDISTLTPLLSTKLDLLSPSISNESDTRPAFFSASELPSHIDLTQLDLDPTHYIYIAPSITKVAVRIYGTSEFTDRACELGLAKAASDKQISEFVYCSWRHGRITSFIDGSSLGPLKWFDPILSSTCGYIQGQLHATNFLSCFAGTSLPIPPINKPQLQDMLKNWCKKSFSTKFYKAIQQQQQFTDPKVNTSKRISSVFDMFTSSRNQLYVINRPATALDTYVRCQHLILPLPSELEEIILPLLNAYQIDSLETEPRESSEFTFPYRSERTIELSKMNCIQSRLLNIVKDDTLTPKQTLSGEIVELCKTVPMNDNPNQLPSTTISNYTIPTPPSRLLSKEESELIMEYLDLPRMREEIQWLISQCKFFPIVTSHNDYHAGNVLLLNSLLQTQFNEPTTHNQEGHIIHSDGTNNSNETTTTTTTTIPQPLHVDLPTQPMPLPNQTSDWIKVIDFEYGGLNYRGYDTANSSNESWIVYAGTHPGFTLDIPGWVSTAFLGQYDPNIMKKDTTQNINTKYTCFQHSTIPTLYNQDRLDTIVQVWSQHEPIAVGDAIQHILLGQHATKLFNYEEYISTISTATSPKFRPREVMWAEACLTGFYHACKQTHQKNCPDPDNTPIYPFQTTDPPQPEFDPQYQLPTTLDEWLQDQLPKLLYETMILQLASMLAWSFWGITFTEGTMVEGFGYLEHALARMIAYVAKKELLIKLNLLQSPYDVKKF